MIKGLRKPLRFMELGGDQAFFISVGAGGLFLILESSCMQLNIIEEIINNQLRSITKGDKFV